MISAELNRISEMLKSGQDQMLKVFVGLSLAIHIIFFVLSHFNLLSFGKPLVPEWAMETELVADFDLGGSDKTVLPNAKKSDEVAVPSNLLPQITKNFAIKTPKKSMEGLRPSDDAVASEEMQKAGDDSADEADSYEDAATRLRKADALKRLALEKLRRQQKTKSKEFKAHESDLMPKLKQALSKDVGIGSSLGGGLVAGAETRRYLAYLEKAIRRNYSLPKNYELKKSQVVTALHIVLNGRGELLSAKVHQSSGDSVFDQYCLKAVKVSAPFKKPPKDRAGETLQLNCN